MRTAALTLALLLLPAAGLAYETVCLDGQAVMAPAGPWHVAVDGGVGVGVFFATHGRVGLSVGRRFFHRVELALDFHYGQGVELRSHEESLRAGLLLHLARRLDLLLGWRVGYAGFLVDLMAQDVRVGALVVSVVGELRLALSPSFELRFAPLTGTGYYNALWAFTLEPALGLGWRF